MRATFATENVTITHRVLKRILALFKKQPEFAPGLSEQVNVMAQCSKIANQLTTMSVQKKPAFRSSNMANERVDVHEICKLFCVAPRHSGAWLHESPSLVSGLVGF